ncbi:hypothetical protein BT63DRAFT_413280 [Microthyrium microscopicum]|uniref:Uncharacterized protein n=1 Tax=Microthyrium microscopicum TaxID=703497 RepID=A0A6A6UFZ2_9PEZI|nr:hypothetical protein BT63DRAFT_413280 [Microthyrium microscopicum]
MNSHYSLEAVIKETFPDPPASDELTIRTPTKLKSRSLSDSTPKLEPSPKLKEYAKNRTQDDNAVRDVLSTPQRAAPPRGLSLCLPPTNTNTSSTLFNRRVPPSPKVESRSPYGSPSSVLPRHSRGLDFSRAATLLHHSTLAEVSPDSSPTIAQRGMMIPGRKQSVNAMSVDPPSWNAERSTISSSLGSVNMFASEDSSSDDDMEPVDPEETEDAILATPNLHKKTSSSNNGPSIYSTGWGPSIFSPAGSNFLSYRRRLDSRKSRKSSSSASGHSNLASPAPTSPLPGKIGEGGFFPRDANLRNTAARRESLSMTTNELTISSGNDSGDEASAPGQHTPGVIRRPVTRRGNLLPKTRAFGRIRAELIEESAPVDTEVKREAEVIRQVRESDPVPASNANTTHSSPSMQPVNSLEDIPEHNDGLLMPLDSNGSTSSTNNLIVPGKGLFGAFAAGNSGPKDFWDTFDKHTPPPATFPRAGSISEDINMGSPILSQDPYETPFAYPSYPHSRASTPQATSNTIGVHPPSAADGLRKNNKRRRDDDFDTTSLKRRAVSPGVSVANSPILSQSPAARGDLWGQQANQAKLSRESSVMGSGCGGHAAGERSNSVSSVVMGTPSLGPKRVGLQGMTDMQGLTEKMSIE